MIKKIVFTILLLFLPFSNLVYASSNNMVRIGNNYYDTLEEAIANASSNDTITLISNVTLKDSLLIDKIVNIDLNGKTISAPSVVFQVQGGVLNINGEGTIKETEPNYGAIKIIGSSDSTDDEYSVVNIGENVTLEGWSGIFITHESSKSYGVVVNFDGKINAVNDVNGGSGAGIYVNGNIKDQTNSPVVNILDNAEITSTGNGLYIAGYSTFNIGKAYISGKESGIGMKAGILNVNWSTIISDGKDATPTEGYNNGIKASGTAIQIESNNGYAGNMELNISNGTFKSKNSNVIYEYIGKGNSSLIKSISISGGTFISEAGKDVFLLSDSFKQIHSGFISGGKYSSNPSAYLKSGYNSTLDNNFYNITKSTLKGVFLENINNNGSIFGKGFIVLVVTVILGGVAYFNRFKISKFFKNRF